MIWLSVCPIFPERWLSPPGSVLLMPVNPQAGVLCMRSSRTMPALDRAAVAVSSWLAAAPCARLFDSWVGVGTSRFFRDLRGGPTCL